MKNTDISQLFGVPFGAQADSTTIAAIPTTKTAIGRASMALGFPKENFQPLDNGGQPVSGADLNGILNTLSRTARAAELGMLYPFSATYAAAIGGYPAGATIAHPSITGRFLICTQDGNSNNPAQSMTGWDDPIGDLAQQIPSAGISGNANLPSGGSAGEAFWSDATGQPQYTDAANGTRALALQSALAAETSRAETAESTLLPLAGGQLTGNLSGSLGGAVPQILGQSGRVVMQTFVTEGSGGSTQQVAFKTAFKAGTVPMVWLQIDNEEGGPCARAASLTVNSNTAGPNITNTGFNFYPAYIASSIGISIYTWTLQVMAIGVM